MSKNDSPCNSLAAKSVAAAPAQPVKLFVPDDFQLGTALAARVVALDRKYGLVSSRVSTAAIDGFVRRTLVGRMGLDGDELVVVHIMLARMYRAASKGDQCAVLYTQSTSVKVKLLAAVYWSGTVLHDQPLAKKYFIGPSGLSWDEFIDATMAFGDTVDNNTQFSPVEMDASRDKLYQYARLQNRAAGGEGAANDDLDVYDEVIKAGDQTNVKHSGQRRSGSLKAALASVFGRIRSASRGKNKDSVVKDTLPALPKASNSASNLMQGDGSVPPPPSQQRSRSTNSGSRRRRHSSSGGGGRRHTSHSQKSRVVGATA